jgi:hypothetical protein
MRVAEVVLQVRVVGVAPLGLSQPRNRLFPLPGDDGLPPGGVILVGGGELEIGLGGRRRWAGKGVPPSANAASKTAGAVIARCSCMRSQLRGCLSPATSGQ